MPDEAVVEQQPGDPQQGAEAEGVAPEGGAPEAQAQAVVDWQARAEATEAELAKVNQRLASIAGNVRKQAEFEALLLRSNRLQEAMLKHLTSADADPDAFRAEVQQIQQAGDQEMLATRTQQLTDSYQGQMFTMLESVGMQDNDPSLAAPRAIWLQGLAAQDPLLLHQAFMQVKDIVDEKKDQARETKAEKRIREAEQRFNQDNDTLGVAVPQGTPGGAGSLGSYIQRLKKGEALPTAEEIDRLTAGYARGN